MSEVMERIREEKEKERERSLIERLMGRTPKEEGVNKHRVLTDVDPESV